MKMIKISNIMKKKLSPVSGECGFPSFGSEVHSTAMKSEVRMN